MAEYVYNVTSSPKDDNIFIATFADELTALKFAIDRCKKLQELKEVYTKDGTKLPSYLDNSGFFHTVVKTKVRTSFEVPEEKIESSVDTIALWQIYYADEFDEVISISYGKH